MPLLREDSEPSVQFKSNKLKYKSAWLHDPNWHGSFWLIHIISTKWCTQLLFNCLQVQNRSQYQHRCDGYWECIQNLEQICALMVSDTDLTDWAEAAELLLAWRGSVRLQWGCANPSCQPGLSCSEWLRRASTIKLILEVKLILQLVDVRLMLNR